MLLVCWFGELIRAGADAADAAVVGVLVGAWR